VTAADTTISFTVNIFNVNDPTVFSATPASSSELILAWQKNPSNSNVVIACNTINQFGVPVNGTTYSPGTLLAGGGQVIYNGSGITFQHNGLLTNTRYYYKAWSVLPATAYSPGVTCNNVTMCETITTLPFTEGFENTSARPGCWYETNTDPAWKFVAGNGMGAPYGYPATAHAGERNACLTDVTAASDYNTLITPLIDVSAYPEVQLKFWLFMQKWGSRQDELIVLYRASPALQWTVAQSFTQSVSSWTQETVNVPSGSGEIQFGFLGNAKWALGICIDDIQVDRVPGVGLGENTGRTISVFPNPTEGIFRITGQADNRIDEITIFDCSGRKMAGIHGNGEKEYTFDLSYASPGIYILKIKTDTEVVIRRLVITR
jgi:hypothetical protein